MTKPFVFLVSVLFAVFLLGRVAYAESFGKTAIDETVTRNPNSSSLNVSFIDVGKGDCILMQSGNTNVFIDTGYEDTAGNVLSYLRSRKVGRVDAMIITHYDSDHIGGIRPIGEDIDIGTIYLPGYDGTDKNYRSCISSIKAIGVPTKRVTKELVLEVGSARLTVYPTSVAYEPGSGKKEGNDNDVSLVASLVNGRDTYLFTGDLEEDGIAAYLEAKHGQYDVLKMPHHGRNASNMDAFLDDVRPKIAVITDAKKNPTEKKVLKLLKSNDVEVWRTSNDGTIVVQSSGVGSYTISPTKG